MLHETASKSAKPFLCGTTQLFCQFSLPSTSASFTPSKPRPSKNRLRFRIREIYDRVRIMRQGIASLAGDSSAINRAARYLGAGGAGDERIAGQISRSGRTRPLGKIGAQTSQDIR
jgi:argininosuccinate lyase